MLHKIKMLHILDFTVLLDTYSVTLNTYITGGIKII